MSPCLAYHLSHIHFFVERDDHSAVPWAGPRGALPPDPLGYLSQNEREKGSSLEPGRGDGGDEGLLQVEVEDEQGGGDQRQVIPTAHSSDR